MWLFIKTKNNSKILKKNVRVLIIILLIMKSLTQFMTELMYFLKKRSSDWINQLRIQKRAKVLTLIIF